MLQLKGDKTRNEHNKKKMTVQARWCTPSVSALWRQRQANLCEFKTSLVYRVSPGQLGLLYREILSPNDNNKWFRLILSIT